MPHVLVDGDTGERRFLDLPRWPGAHPSFSPSGDLSVTDVALGRLEGPLHGEQGEWGILVERLDADDHVLLHRFDHSRGARSWRISHPHPIFSAGGRRIYFCTSSAEWTRLYVAEAGS